MADAEPLAAAERHAGLRLPLRTPRSWSPQPPKSPLGWSIGAIGAALLTIVAAYATGEAVRSALAAPDIAVVSPVIDGAVYVVTAAATILLVPAFRSLAIALRTRRMLTSDIAEARALAAAARGAAWYTLGYVAAALLVLFFVFFIAANELAVGTTFFNVELIGNTFGLILSAFWINVEIFCIAQIFVLAWGLIIAVARLAPGEAGKPIRLIATVYVDLFRALPAIISIYLVGFGLPLTGLPPFGWMAPMWLAILALTLTYGAYVSEVYRAGIESVHPSQTAAARSLGLSYGQSLRFVIIPQAVRRIIPPLLNDFISLQKDTALVSVIGTIDAFNQAKMVASNHFNLSSVTTVAILFVIITIPQARFVDRLMEADQRRMRAGV